MKLSRAARHRVGDALADHIENGPCQLILRRGRKTYECHVWARHRSIARQWGVLSEVANRWRPAEGCPQSIEPGTEYVESMDSAPGYSSGDRYCVPCAREHFR